MSLYEFDKVSKCLKLSIIKNLSFNKIILLCFPISSTIKYLVVRSFNSLYPSNSIFIILSKLSLEDIDFILYPIKCFLSNMQKLGAFRGFGFVLVVKCILYKLESIHIFKA